MTYLGQETEAHFKGAVDLLRNKNIHVKNSFIEIGIPRTRSQEFLFQRRASCPSIMFSHNQDVFIHEGPYGGARDTPNQGMTPWSGLKIPEVDLGRTVSTPLLEMCHICKDWSAADSDDENQHASDEHADRGQRQPSYSVGSAGHGVPGLVCSPCAFYFSVKGCTNAKACNFCHLCPHGEFKKQKKIKLSGLKDKHRTQKEARKENECERQREAEEHEAPAPVPVPVLSNKRKQDRERHNRNSFGSRNSRAARYVRAGW
eukprot:GEMP01001405.1.p1 GENE.GEMP01001405.1~~GEMP01001405.1.p1  ORF type:complete len:259 (+),score=33.09 GEMP01001405.1:93-869(+)